MFPRRLGMFLTFAVLGFTVFACAQQEAKKAPATAKTTKSSSNAKAEFRVFPETLYSGFGGTTQAYKVPVLGLNAPGAVTWTVEDPSMAVVDSTSGSNVTFKTLKAGTTKVTATSGGQSVSVDLVINEYTTADWTAGQQRYTNGADAKNPACNTCHNGAGGPDHTPTELDADPDDEIAVTFTTGVDPEGRPVNDGNHKWTVTDAQKKGLMSYLRSLPPTGYPEPDHGLGGE